MSFVIIASSSNGPTVKKAELTDWMDTIAMPPVHAQLIPDQRWHFIFALSLFLSLNRR